MSSLFQGLVEADGKVRVTTGPATRYHRGLAIAGDAVVAEDYVAQPISWVCGVALTPNGHLLLSNAAGVSPAPGGLLADASGVIVKGSTIDVIHQGVGLTSLGELVSVTMGPELVLNGDFCADGANWTETGGVVSTTYTTCQQVRIQALENSNTNIRQQVTTEIGKTYRLSGEVRTPSSNIFDLKGRLCLAGFATAGEFIYVAVTASDVWQPLSVDWVATDTNPFVRLDLAGSGGDDDWAFTNDVAEFRNISLKEVA